MKGVLLLKPAYLLGLVEAGLGKLGGLAELLSNWVLTPSSPTFSREYLLSSW